MIVPTSSKDPNETALVDLLIADFPLLLYFNDSRTRSRNSIGPIFQNFSLFISVLLCKLTVVLSTVAMIVKIKQDANCF